MAVTLDHEQALGGVVLGVDEAGRGPLAGGVFAGYKGTVQAISEDQKELTVLVSAGRREMPIMLSTSEVKADKDN